MRIGFFSERYLPQTDGVSYAIEALRSELESMGHEVYVITSAPGFRYKEKSPRIMRFPSIKGIFFDDNLSTFFFPPKAIHDVEKLKLDIIHFHTPSPIGLLGANVAIKQHIPLVTTYHTDLYEYVTRYPEVFPGIMALSLAVPFVTNGDMNDFRDAISMMKPERNIDAWNQKIVARMVTVLHNRCDQVIAPSRKTRDQLLSWHTKTPITVIPTGVDKLATTPHDLQKMRAKYSIDPDEKVILFVGRLGKEKNIELLLDAFPLVADKVDNARLIIVGDNANRVNLEEHAEKLGIMSKTTFTGFIVRREELGALYELATVFAFPSLTDTQALSINEAAHGGLPVVMVDPDITEVVKNGQNGYFAKPTAKDFAAKIVKVLNNDDLRHSMSIKSVEYANGLSLHRQSAKLVNLYESAIKTLGTKKINSH